MRKPGINLTVGFLLLVVSFGISAPVLWGAAQLVKEDEVEEPAGANGGDGMIGGPVDVTLVAENIDFDQGTITASTGVEVTVTLDNQDAGVLHNVAFYTDRSASSSIFVGDTFPGVAIETESFTAPATAGSYFFRCDVHPDQMTGTFEVR